MSSGYAERLSEYPNKGVCGLPENYDSQRAFTSKLDRLARLIRQSKYTVVLTGAGISTTAGIPDFRGPTGIWTREQQERKRRKKNNSQKKASLGLDCAEKASDCSGKNNETTKSSATNNNNNRKRKETEMEDTERPTKATFTSFENALPTYTHKALSHLILHPPPTTQSFENQNTSTPHNNNTTHHQRRTHHLLHHIVTQNVDGLHRKTNLPRDKMSILHGCIFTEICDTCHTEHVREREIQSIGLKHTGRKCERTLGVGKGVVGDNGNVDPSSDGASTSCPGKLKDTLLDWEDDLPEMDWARAQEECYKADLVLCLGTSLRIEPAASLCTYATAAVSEYDPGKRKSKGRKNKKKKKASSSSGSSSSTKLGYAIVNLQQTPYDDGAALVVRGKVDDVMKGLMERLGYESNWEAMAEVIVIDD